MKAIATLILALQLTSTLAQVSEIKQASSVNSKNGGGDHSSSAAVGTVAYFFIESLDMIADWQQMKLQKKEVNPYLVSLDIISQWAIQPSQYYLFNPRIRGNWGLLSTDFRVNYLLEETATGTDDLTSLDWQILQLNMVTTRNVIGRIGGGIMQENYGGRQSFFESTYGVFIQSNRKNMGGSIEYRVAYDFNTDVNPRREWSAQFEQRILSKGYWNTYVTVGAVYQRYYESISVWGLQMGIAIRVFSPPLER
jgi:hypothetical protein